MAMLTACVCGKYIPLGTKCSCKVSVKRVVSDAEREHSKLFTTKRWSKFRIRMIKRDGAVCTRCLIKYNLITTAKLEVHHIKSRINHAELDPYDESNCIIVCRTCNMQLGTKDELDYEPPEMPTEYEINL